MLTGKSSAAVLSEKRAAASWARTVGSSAELRTALFNSGLASFFAWYVGSTNTKSLAELFWVGFVAGAVLFGAERRSITRGEKGDIGCVTGVESAATVFGCAAEFPCSVSTSFPAGPGVKSYAQAFSRSTTTRVVGCAWPFMPMRTSLIPAASTAMWLWPVAITVSG